MHSSTSPHETHCWEAPGGTGSGRGSGDGPAGPAPAALSLARSVTDRWTQGLNRAPPISRWIRSQSAQNRTVRPARADQARSGARQEHVPAGRYHPIDSTARRPLSGPLRLSPRILLSGRRSRPRTRSRDGDIVGACSTSRWQPCGQAGARSPELASHAKSVGGTDRRLLVQGLWGRDGCTRPPEHQTPLGLLGRRELFRCRQGIRGAECRNLPPSRSDSARPARSTDAGYRFRQILSNTPHRPCRTVG